MPSRMWAEAELEAKFKQIGPKPAAAIALRAALRVLPLLAKSNPKRNQDFLWFWGADKAKHLLAILRVYDVGFTRLHVDNAAYVAYAARTAVEAAVEAARADYYAARAIRVAADAVDVASAARTVTYAADTYAVFRARAYAGARTAADAARTGFANELKADFNHIESGSIPLLLQRPLWVNPPSRAWFVPSSALVKQLGQFDGGSFAHWADWYEARLDGQVMDEALQLKRLRIPDEVEAQGVRKINAYLAELSKATSQSNRVRALFIGKGEAGKTSLIRALHGEKVVAGKEEPTPGIDIRDWPVVDTDLKAVLWDFGGQVMAHASHQFFLRSSCVYVVVLNARESVTDANNEAEYWLEHVKAFGDAAPVLLVANKADVGPVWLDMTRLAEKYPNIVGLYEVSCTQYQDNFKSQFDIFCQAFAEQLKLVSQHTAMFNDAQFAVLNKLQDLAKESAFLPEADYALLCKQKGIPSDSEQDSDWLLDLMDKLGVVLHFPKIAGMREYVLNPQWLTYGVNALVFAEQARGGRLSLQQIEQILCGISNKASGNYLEYPVDKCDFIIHAMASFELAYRLPDGQHIIMPALLPSETPAHDFVKADCLKFEYQFKSFLPSSVMPNFIVRRHEQIHASFVWQLGVYLHDNSTDSAALVEVDYQVRSLTLWVKGQRANAYLTQLLGDVDLILGRFKALEYDAYVWLAKPCLLGGAEAYRGGLEKDFVGKARFKDLLALEQKGQQGYISADGTFDLSCVLGVMPVADRREYAKEVGVVNNYHIHGQAAIGSNARIDVGTFNQQINVIGKELDDGIADLIAQLKFSSLGQHEKNEALDQLRTVREEVAIAQNEQEKPARRKEALETISGFAKQVDSGLGTLNGVFKKLSDSEKHMRWLAEKGAQFGELLSNMPI